jgi:ATP-dependent DNA ligase
VLSGELYGMQDNKAIQPQHLGGLLNSSLEKSLTNQADQNIKLKNTIFDIRQLGNKPITNQIPYNERMQHIHNILNSITGADADLVKNVYSPAEEATTPEAAKALTEQITSGQHPLTNEGIIIHPNKGNPLKAKLTDEHDVHIRGVIPGKGKYTDKGIGAFIYSHEPEGPIAGEVGSGLSDAVRADMFSNPEEYVGRKARVRATKVLPSGALFQPSLISLHEG